MYEVRNAVVESFGIEEIKQNRQKKKNTRKPLQEERRPKYAKYDGFYFTFCDEDFTLFSRVAY